jgi:hypothetical protein
VVNFKAHALLAQVVTAEAKTLFRVGLRCGERAEAARVGAPPALQSDHFRAERREQHPGEFPTFVAAFYDDGPRQG